jgi:hypothetical protein
MVGIVLALGFGIGHRVSAQTTTNSSTRVSESPARIVSLRLVPENPTLWGSKASQRFVVLGKYADGLERDLTLHTRLWLAGADIARVEPAGQVVAVTDGSATLTATVDGHSVTTGIRVQGSRDTRPFSFARDLGGIFTRQGCNDSACHGGPKGKAGFKLSINAMYPRDDYKWIVEGGAYQVLTADTGPKVARINLNDPEKSLLLLKPTFTVPHGGGERFKVDSRDYETIVNWIRNGAPYGTESSDKIRIEKLEVFPQEAVLDEHGKHQLLVTAWLSNGQHEDLTDQVRFISNNPEVVTVSPEGLVQAVRTGETAVMVRAAGYAVSARFGVISKALANYPEVPRNNFIDGFVFDKLRKFNIVPSPLSSDAEFLRRVCLDLTGTLPPPARVREFSASTDPQKRPELIETLLNTPEYVEYWTFRFADLFRVSRYGNGIDGLNSEAYWEWIRNSIATNKPYDRMARERIAAQGDDGPSRHYLSFNTQDPQTKMAEEVRVFMGRRLDCAQCHNHPFEAWSQDQFWGMAAFFGRVNTVKEPSMGEAADVIYDDPAGQEVAFGVKDKSRKVLNPRTQVEVQPTFLDGRILTEDKRGDLRMELATWMTSHPYFAEAAVNRIWSYFFGKGIVEPVDDFRSTNPPTHPALLSALAVDFQNHGYDLKHMIRTIVSSRTYQLSSETNETNQGDEINYSHSVPRPLDAEVLLDAISYVTEVPEIFEHQTNQDDPGTEPPGTRAINLREPDIYPSPFCDMYGRSLRLQPPERPAKPNLIQALHMLAGSTYADKIAQPGGRVDQLVKSEESEAKVIEELYLIALSRFPTAREQAKLRSLISEGPRKAAVQDLVWALISSREFSETH